MYNSDVWAEVMSVKVRLERLIELTRDLIYLQKQTNKLLAQLTARETPEILGNTPNELET